VRVEHEILTLHTRDPFVIARGAYAEHVNVLVRLTGDDGEYGLGEAAPNAYYGETPRGAVEALERAAPLLEQPLPADDIDGLRELQSRTAIPIIADESCRVAADVQRLAGVVHGINIKLAKCGGLSEARRMISAARARGMSVMAGCVIESSVGISGIAQLAPLLDYADLDGAALLADDPFTGVSIPGGRIVFPDGPGIGVRRRDAA